MYDFLELGNKKVKVKNKHIFRFIIFTVTLNLWHMSLVHRAIITKIRKEFETL
jgi:hypothetical protein